MKKFLALAVLATTSASFAAERNLYDIMYLPNAGTTYGFSTVSYVDREIDFNDNTTELSGYVYEQTFGHAFTDEWSVQLSADWTNFQGDQDGGESYDAEQGLSDPSLTTRFRMWDSAYQWDLLGGVTFGLGDRELDTDLSTNNRQGGHSAFIGTQFGAQTGHFQWAVLGLATQNFERTTEIDESADNDGDSNNELLIRGDILKQLGSEHFLRSHLAVEWTEEIQYDSGDNDPLNSAPASLWQVGLEYQYLASESLLWRAGVDYTTQSYDTADLDHDKALTFLLGANYQF